MSENKLLPCPFCNTDLEIIGKGHYFAHKTNGCILQHLCFETDYQEAVQLWNTRKPMEQIVERLEERKNSFHGGLLQENYYWKGIEEAIEIVKGVMNE